MTDLNPEAPQTESTESTVPVIEAGSAGSMQVVVFSLGEQDFCVDIMSVREIRAWTGTTPLPKAADFVRGVVNLRGVVVPIIDLRSRFERGETDPTKNHVVVIVAVGEQLNGVLVDAVSDILTIAVSDLQPIPETDANADAQNPFLDGMITHESRMIGLIALDRLTSQTVVH